MVSADDQGVVDLIEQGDVINSVTLSGDFEPLLDRVEQVAGWKNIRLRRIISDHC